MTDASFTISPQERLPPDVVLSVQNVSKKFCRNLHRSMIYGLQDLFQNFLMMRGSAPINHFSEPIQDLCSGGGLRRDEFWALQNVSFELKRGEIMGFVGRNGSGKSTLLRVITGLFPPDSGCIQLRGRVGALIALGAGFHPHMTGRENIILNGTILGMTQEEIRNRFDDIVTFSEIGDFLDAPVSTYSSGMTVRLGFAIAAHINPDLMIIDEVLSVGDAAFQRKCLDHLHGLKEKGASFIIVSHNMQLLNSLCDSGLYLEHGSAVRYSSIHDATSAYLRSITISSVDKFAKDRDDCMSAPGNDFIRIKMISIVYAGSRSSSPIDRTEPFCIAIEYWNLKSLATLYIDLCVYRLDGSPAFESLSTEGNSMPQSPMDSGLYKSVCFIPGKLLNEGTYIVRLIFVNESRTAIYDESGVLQFTVVAPSKRSFATHNEYIGAVHPELEWQTSRVGDL